MHFEKDWDYCEKQIVGIHQPETYFEHSGCKVGMKAAPPLGCLT